MSNDDLAEAFGKLLAELHAKVDALPEGQIKTKGQHKVALAHEALERVREHFAMDGQVQPLSGGDPKTPPPAP